jgi:hypothetical protein
MTTNGIKGAPLSAAVLLGAGLVLGGACGNGGNDNGNPDGGLNGTIFSVPTQIYGADFATSSSFVPFLPSLDVPEVSLESAREVADRASVRAIGDWVFIASSAAPVIDRFKVGADGALIPDGSLNFASYGLPAFFSIDPWGNVPISDTKAYIFNRADGSHIIWNPTALRIEGQIAAPGVVMEGWTLEGSPGFVRGNRMYRTFGYLDYDAWRFNTTTQHLAVYDVDTNKLISLTQDNRCPLIYSRPFIDENNDIYFSGWVWTPAETLINKAPKNCALRIRNGQDAFDPDWQLTYADDVTGGREGGILRYLGNGKALLDVFYHEKVDITPETTAADLTEEPFWRLWMIDLNTKTGGPIEQLGFKAGGYTDVSVDGRTFLMVPNEDYSETTAWEVTPSGAQEGFKIQGSAYQIIKVR